MKTTIISAVAVIIVIIALAISSQGVKTILLSNGVEAGIGTKITYSDGTSDIASSKLSLGSLGVFKNEKSTESVTYTPYIMSQKARTIDMDYNIVAINTSKNVIFSKGSSTQFVITSSMTNQILYLPPVSLTTSDLLSSITSTQDIDLRAIVTIDGNRLQSNVITFKVKESVEQPVVTPPLPPVQPPQPAITTTPQPTPSASYQLIMVKVSGDFT